MEDAKTTGRWYFITTMGRYTGHLALGIGKAAGATVTLIPEEFPARKLSPTVVADIIEGAIIKRLYHSKNHGVAVLAEGIAHMFDLNELQKYEEITRDETGRVRLSEIELGRVLKNFVTNSLGGRGIQMTIVSKTIGYELRAADPIPFDVEYTRNLGYGAVKYLLNDGSGAMIALYDGHLRPIPLRDIVDPSTGKTRIRQVIIDSEGYKVAREYMIRLERNDFERERLKGLSEIARMSPKSSGRNFQYLKVSNVFNIRLLLT